MHHLELITCWEHIIGRTWLYICWGYWYREPLFPTGVYSDILIFPHFLESSKSSYLHSLWSTSYPELSCTFPGVKTTVCNHICIFPCIFRLGFYSIILSTHLCLFIFTLCTFQTISFVFISILSLVWHFHMPSIATAGTLFPRHSLFHIYNCHEKSRIFSGL